jgi:hypothetical protein
MEGKTADNSPKDGKSESQEDKYFSRTFGLSVFRAYFCTPF